MLPMESIPCNAFIDFNYEPYVSGVDAFFCVQLVLSRHLIRHGLVYYLSNDE
jgi:hypothetical protein